MTSTTLVTEQTPMVVYVPTTQPKQTSSGIQLKPEDSPIEEGFFDNLKRTANITSIVKAGIFCLVLIFLLTSQKGNTTELIKGLKIVADALLTIQREQIASLGVMIRVEEKIADSYSPFLPLGATYALQKTFPAVDSAYNIANGWLLCPEDQCVSIKSLLINGVNTSHLIISDRECANQTNNMGVYIRPKVRTIESDLPLLVQQESNCLTQIFNNTLVELWVIGKVSKNKSF